MAGILHIDNPIDEIARQEQIQRRLSQSPTWREIIDLLAETQAHSQTMEAYVFEMMLKDYPVESVEQRNNLLRDFATKAAFSIRSRKETLVQELTAALCKDIA
jgi:hypothetical protein